MRIHLAHLPRCCAVAPSFALAACLLALAGCDGGTGAPAPSGPPPVLVETDTARREELVDIVDLVGQLEAEEEVMVKPETEGTIASVEFEEGARVAAGALLFRLKADEQQARRRERVARLTLAQQDYERAKSLRAAKTISQSELDRAQSNWQQATAERDLAEVELRRTEIRAPFDGVLGARLVSPGDRVERETELVSIQSVDRLRLVFAVPEIALPVARAGVPVSVAVAPLPGEVFPGEVYFVAPAFNTQTRQLLLKAWVPNARGLLRPGLFANIKMQVERRADVLTVPETAVAYDTQGPHVWRIGTEQKAERVPVEIGIRQRGRAEIKSGDLAAGDRLVSAGTHKVFPGAIIRDAAAAVDQPS